jgi:hypothetical protein
MARFSDDGLTRAFRIASWMLILVGLAFFTESLRGERTGVTSVVQVLGLLLAVFWAQVALDVRGVARRLVALAESGRLLGEPPPADGGAAFLFAPWRTVRAMRIMAAALTLLSLLWAGRGLEYLFG